MASSAGSDRENEWENGDRTGSDMDACRIKGGDLLRMLARAYTDPIFLILHDGGEILRDKSRSTGPTIVCWFVERKIALEKLI